MRLSDTIEEFIKNLMTQQEAEFKRSELAQYFSCSPSQINYVLSTRFTPANGYVIESQRGGGGCIRIFRIQVATGDELIKLLNSQIGQEIDEISADQVISGLLSRNVISRREAGLMQAAVSSQALSLPIPLQLKNELRAKILKQMLLKAVSASNE